MQEFIYITEIANGATRSIVYGVPVRKTKPLMSLSNVDSDTRTRPSEKLDLYFTISCISRSVMAADRCKSLLELII